MSDPYQPFIDRLSSARRVLVTTHVRPDGDAIGSTAALVVGLRRKGIAAEVLLFSHAPSKYSFVYDELSIPHIDVERGWPAAVSLERFDTLLVADTGTWSQLPGLRERLEGWRGQKLVLDHHLTQQDWADLKLVEPAAAAAGEIVAALLRAWGIEIDRQIAMPLFVAIATDTGWFQFSNTRPQTLRLAADLVETGLDTDRLYQLLYQNERPQRLALQTRALQSLELLAGGKLAVMTIRKEDFADTGAAVPDTENLINIPLQVRGVEISLLLIEEPPPAAVTQSSVLSTQSSVPPIRVSLRSKGAVDVARFAEQFQGGGHARAAGLKLRATLREAHDRVVEAAKAALATDEHR